VQVDPMKPKLKPPGSKRLKLEYDGLPSNLGFKFNVRRYTERPGGDDANGRAVQVDPIKPALKPPGTKRLKL